jgi:hypothetical protein
MYAQSDYATHSSVSSTARPTRATLQTRPRIQRTLIRSWEYIQPVRVSLLVVRMIVTLWLIFVGTMLMSAGHTWGWTLLPAAGATLAVSVWVYATAARGWPVVEA